MSVIVCSICHYGLAESPHSASGTVEVVSLTCGHLYHKICVNQWFQRKSTRSTNECSVICPCCQKSCPLTSLVRVYPTCEGQESVRGTTLATAPCQFDIDPDIFDKLDSSTKAVEDLNSILEHEAMDRVILKSQNEKLQSDLNVLKEKEEIHTSIVESVKSEMRILQERNRKLEDKMRNLRRQLESLKTVQGETREMIIACKDAEQDNLHQILQGFENLDIDTAGSSAEASLIQMLC